MQPARGAAPGAAAAAPAAALNRAGVVPALIRRQPRRVSMRAGSPHADIAMPMTSLLPFVLAMGAAQAVPEPAAWSHAVDEHGARSAQVAGSARFGAQELPARLTLRCAPGDGGTVSWSLLLEQADRYGEFGLVDFEGPDAPAASSALTKLRLMGGLLQPQMQVAVAGWYSAEFPGAFVLSLAAPANAASEAALLADAIGAQTQSFNWRVASFQDPSRGIEAQFDTRAAQAAVRETMMGCGPTPAFPPEAPQAWQGRNPNGIELWRRSPLEWGLKGLLGRDYDAFVARMAGAQPIAREGEVYYVLAPDPAEPRSGAALLFDAQGEMEVIRVDAGLAIVAARHPRALPRPDAVRAFVAERAEGGIPDATATTGAEAAAAMDAPADAPMPAPIDLAPADAPPDSGGDAAAPAGDAAPAEGEPPPG